MALSSTIGAQVVPPFGLEGLLGAVPTASPQLDSRHRCWPRCAKRSPSALSAYARVSSS